MNTSIELSGRLVDWLERFPSILAAGAQVREVGKSFIFILFLFFSFLFLFVFFFGYY